MSAIEILVGEHRVIQRMLKVVASLHDQVENGHVDSEALKSVVDFFRVFADKAHHAKEENMLFPALENNGVRPQGCPVGTLKLEHKQGRTIITVLDEAIRKYAAGDPQAKDTISATLKNTIDFYTDHIWREDYLLFPMSEKVLSKSALKTLANHFSETDANLGSDLHNKYESLVNDLEKRISPNPNIGALTGKS